MKEHRMKRIVVLLVLFFALPVSAQPGESRKAPAAGVPAGVRDVSYKEISWEALVPKNWDPAKRFRNMDLAALDDGDRRAMKLLDMLKEEWDNAPIDPSLDGRKVKIPGFVVPLEEEGRAVTEFLLVPYFGACIHVPPPPANQIIHVISAKPIKNLRVMDAVWVSGELKAARYSKQTPMGMGAAGYQIDSTVVIAYKEPARRRH
jgi:uncharacterized protein